MVGRAVTGMPSSLQTASTAKAVTLHAPILEARHGLKLHDTYSIGQPSSKTLKMQSFTLAIVFCNTARTHALTSHVSLYPRTIVDHRRRQRKASSQVQLLMFINMYLSGREL